MHKKSHKNHEIKKVLTYLLKCLRYTNAKDFRQEVKETWHIYLHIYTFYILATPSFLVCQTLGKTTPSEATFHLIIAL